jgi:hypothetical protein
VIPEKDERKNLPGSFAKATAKGRIDFPFLTENAVRTVY